MVAVVIYRVFHGQNCGTWEVPGAFILMDPLMCYLSFTDNLLIDLDLDHDLCNLIYT